MPSFGDCITICTIHPKYAYYLLHYKCYYLPKASVTTFPKVISLTKFVIVEKYGVSTIYRVTNRVRYTHNHEYVYIHNIIFNYRSN